MSDTKEAAAKKPVIDKFVSEILPHLYLCNRAKASNPNILNAYNIKTVLTVMDYPIEDNKKVPNIDYQYVDMDDECSADILSYMETFNLVIYRGLQKGNVLVHCLAGVSRSVTAIAAYLIASLNFTVLQAIDVIREGRFRAGPNDGFFNQLGVFEKRVQKFKEGTELPAALHILEILADNDKFGDFKLASKLLKERPSHYQVPHDRYTLHCKACEMELLDWSSIMCHDGVSCNSYFTVQDTLSAIADFSYPAGNTHVLKCSCGADLGESDAYYGVKCSCGWHAFPGYQILKERVTVKRSNTSTDN